MGEVWIYGAIGAAYIDGVSPEQIRAELGKLPRGQRVTLRINSPGGDVFDAVSIHTLFAQWSGGVHVQIDGLAASAASYLATLGRTVSIARDGMVMIHDAWSNTSGNADDHKATAELLEQLSDNITSAYVAKTGKSKSEIRAAMKAEAWFTANEALDFGLVDVVLGDRGEPVRTRAKAVAPRVAAMQRELQLARARAGVI